MELSADELRVFLDQKAQQYNHPDFITSDPIQIPKRFQSKEDIEAQHLANKEELLKLGKYEEVTG